MLKRKNEEFEESKESPHYVKRVALDAEAVERKDIEDDKQKTSVSLSTNDNQQDDNQPNGNLLDDDQSQSHIEASSIDSASENLNKSPSNLTQPPSSIPSKEDFVSKQTNDGPISSHKVQDNDPTYVHFRMLASISDTANIVGKGGEAINKIKDQSNARVNVSENLKGIPERIISVRGSAEYVAKAFGLIIRTINNEPFDQSSNIDSKSYNLKLLFPHSIMGYIIGKKGSRFREIEENSAAALKANDQILPASTDRILNITGVADAIHIATYYVAQTVIEHKQQILKAVYYNPANYSQPSLPALSLNQNNNNSNINNNKQNQFSNFNNQHNMMGMQNSMMSNIYDSNQMKMQMGFNPMMSNGMINTGNQMLHNNVSVSSNTKPGETITGPDGKINQDLFVPQKHIGLVIGRGGKNLKDIRQNTGCYVKVNDEIPGSIDRKLTLIGNVYGIQNAIILINNKIENEKQRQQRDENNN